MKRFIYADNAATTKLDIDAFEAMKPYLLEEYGNASQPYVFARKPRKALKEARSVIASCINAEPEEIFFTSGGTESNNWVLKSLTSNNQSGIITSAIEHHSVLNAVESATKNSGLAAYLPPTNEGVVLPSVLKKTLSPETKLVSIMFANNEIGTIQPIKELCEIAHEHGALFHTDAVQAVGHVKIDVKELGVDFLSASAHKFNGPKGIGFLYIKKGIKIAPLLNGGAQEFQMRAGTENVAAIVGMAVALEKNCNNLQTNQEHLRALEKKFIDELNIQDIRFVRNGASERIPGNISLSFQNADGEALLHLLDLRGIAVSTGSACDSVHTQISHVLKAIALDESYAKGTIRISLGVNNSIEEIPLMVDAIKYALKV